MQIKVMISQNVKDYWNEYGGCSYAVNRLLQEVNYQDIPILRNESDKMTKILVDVTNEEYLSLREVFGARSSHISLSRLLTFFAIDDYAGKNDWPKCSETHDKKYSFNIHKVEALRHLGRMLQDCDNRQQLLQAMRTISETSYGKK